MQRKALQPASPWLAILPWRDMQSTALFCGLLAFGTCANHFRDPFISGEWCWRTKGTVNTSKAVPFSLRLKVSLKWDLYFFLFFADGDVYVAVFSTMFRKLISKDVLLMSVPCVWSTWQITFYFMHSLTQCILWLFDQLPVEVNCRQLLKVPADRHKNGHLRKYHYGKIRNPRDYIARTGVRDIGFKSRSLTHDPGGITCMVTMGLPD